MKVIHFFKLPLSFGSVFTEIIFAYREGVQKELFEMQFSPWGHSVPCLLLYLIMPFLKKKKNRTCLLAVMTDEIQHFLPVIIKFCAHMISPSFWGHDVQISLKYLSTFSLTELH